MLLQFELNYPALASFKIGESATLGETIEFLARQIKDPAAQLREHTGEWPVGWLDLPAGGQHVDDSKRIAGKLAGEYDELIVCGIGGSALGAQAVHSALDLPGKRLRRLHFLDNADPTQLSLLLEDVDLGKCAINVISKSGGTLETMTAFFYLLGEMKRRGLSASDIAGRIVATTDPSSGILRDMADAQGWETLPVPGDVGGRFSVLTAVGLLPLAFAGVDIDSLLKGAAELQEYALAQPLADNPAWRLAAVHFLLHTRAGIHDTVHYIYGDPLVQLGDWFRQLWAESLAKGEKVDASPSGIGQTPVVARGSTDQHSQNQLYMEGPNDKLYGFITCLRWPSDPVLELPELAPREKFSHIAGKRFSEYLDACRQGTRDALIETGRPVYELVLHELSAEAVGAYLQLWMLATGFAGLLYDVNPFNQPGVERSKQITKQRLSG